MYDADTVSHWCSAITWLATKGFRIPSKNADLIF